MRFFSIFPQDYKQCFEGAGTNPGEKTLEDKFFEYEVRPNWKYLLSVANLEMTFLFAD